MDTFVVVSFHVKDIEVYKRIKGNISDKDSRSSSVCNQIKTGKSNLNKES